MTRLLLVEDETSLVMTLTDRLLAEGFEVTHAETGERALELAGAEPFDIVLLDVALPGRDGFDVCRALRQRGSTVPILMLTAKSQVVDKVLGLKLGADDYLTKPFDTLELLARIEALLRRQTTSISQSDSFTFGPVQVNFAAAETTVGGNPVELSALEFKLLCHLIENRGRVLSRQQLLDEVWGYEKSVQSRTVDVHVSSLRQKIEPVPAHPRYIRTVHGRGYKLTV